MDESLKQIIEETFASKRQQRYFFAKANDKSLPKKKRTKWKKWAHEFADKTDFKKIPEVAEENIEKEVDEIVDADGNIATGEIPTNFATKGTTAKKTSDEVARAVGGQMGGAGLDGGGNAARLMRYFGEADLSKALGAEETIMQDVGYDEAKEFFQDELGIPEDETTERLEKMGYDETYPEGKIRLIENPRKFVEEYLETILPKRTNTNDVVEKDNMEVKEPNPIIKKQIEVLKQTLKDNGISPKYLMKYLKDNE